MADADRQWRRSIEQQVARARAAGSAAGPHSHDEYLTLDEAVDAGFLTRADADQLYAAVGSVGGGLTQLLADLRYAAIVHSHPYAATVHTHSDYPAPSDGTPSTVADTGSPGNGSAYARWNHVHGKGTHSHPIGDLPTGTTGTTVAVGNHTHPAASGVTVQKVTADQALTAVALVDITGLGFAVAANGNYEFEYLLAITSAALTTGWQFGFTGPASPTMFAATCEYQSSATAWTTATLTAVGNFPLVTAAYAAATPIVVRIKGVLANGANAGTLQLRGGTEVANSAITVKRGSTLKVT
jgi:hypothetical protein